MGTQLLRPQAGLAAGEPLIRLAAVFQSCFALCLRPIDAILRP